MIWRRHSASLGRPITVSGWGHYGRPVVVFAPDGDALQVERYRLIEAVAPLIDAGRVKIYSADRVSGEAGEAVFVADELCPLVWEDCGRTPQRFIAVGLSLGAAPALTLGLLHPERIEVALALSAARVPGLPLKAQVDQRPARRVVLAVGRGRLEAPEETAALAAALRRRGVPVQVETWGHDANHDWPTWGRMLRAQLDALA